MTKINTKRLVESAILIAVGTILSVIKFIDLPFGGGITLFSMLPIVMLSYRYGMKWGFFSATVYAMLQLAIGLGTDAFALSLGSMLIMVFLDYIVAYVMLGLGGLFRNRFKSPTIALVFGSTVAVVARYAIHMVSGAIFFGSYAEWFFGDITSGFNPEFGKFFLSNFSGVSLSIIYSIIFNGLLMVCELALTVIGAIVVSKIPMISKKMDEKKEQTKSVA